MIKSNERSPDILADSSREGTNEINSGVACFLLRDVGRRAERLSQRNDIIRDDPNRFFRMLANVEIFGTLTGFVIRSGVKNTRERERV